MTSPTILGLARNGVLTGRWPLFAAGLAIQTTIGALFAWSVFLDPLRSATGSNEATLLTPYRYSLACFLVGLLFASQAARRHSPQMLARVGGWMLTAGALLAASAGPRLDAITLGIGVLGGLGAGIAYMAPVSTFRHWLPDNRGVFLGVSTICFGLGGVLASPVLTGLMQPGGVAADESLRLGFSALAILFLVGVVGAGELLPLTRSWLAPPVLQALNGTATADAADRLNRWSGHVVPLLRLWLLWAVFFLGAFAGFVGIQHEVPTLRTTPWSEALLAAGLCVVAIGSANRIGRSVWATIAARLGRFGTLVLLLGFSMAASLLLTDGMPQLSAALSTLALVGFGFGGFLGLMPQLAGEMLDHRHSLPVAFGVMFSAFGLCAFAAPFWLTAQRPDTLLGQVSLLAASTALLVGFLYLLVRPTTAGSPASQAISRW